ncbi:uncharacterized protein BXZ73DRAFT_76524 [Epithele typhae]|uniref:uncharacterized protein n=1 Tax=Epithele typhae TaxID=378194 RepID=UPI00200867A4|nr:uncharacterized protein BXZ73DRAFT_76524 [Epithele typhae]KAH9937896.1 hypothetical protein BXZ73DRAFT_76524 [Epithele typhae]
MPLSNFDVERCSGIARTHPMKHPESLGRRSIKPSSVCTGRDSTSVALPWRLQQRVRLALAQISVDEVVWDVPHPFPPDPSISPANPTCFPLPREPLDVAPGVVKRVVLLLHGDYVESCSRNLTCALRTESHLDLTTAVFATCGIRLWVFILAATLSLPKQLVLVFIGDDRFSRIVKIVVIVLAVMVTIGARVDAIKQEVIYARRKASYDTYRQAKQLEADADEVDAPKLRDVSVAPAPVQ